MRQSTKALGRKDDPFFNSSNMEKEQLIERAKGQLDRVLGFFPRVDTVSSIILGIDIGMLAFLASKAVTLPISLPRLEASLCR